MKKVALIFLLFLGMTLSFVAIGLVILFATGAVTSMDEARALLTGQTLGQESAFLKGGEVDQVGDGLVLLRQQKQELEQQLIQLKEDSQTLEKSHTQLSDKVKELLGQEQEANANQAQSRGERLEQLRILYDAMRPADAAAIFDQMPDAMVLELLPKLKEKQAARILNSLADDARKASLSETLLSGGKPTPN